MRGINHLVLCGHDLQAMRNAYARLGFTLTPKGVHPFGTVNSLVQLDHAYLELLAVENPQVVPEHAHDDFSFAAFNRDFLKDSEGFSMLAFDSEDARADVALFEERGWLTYKPVDFARLARLPSGEEVSVGFSLAFVRHPDMPRAGFFGCQHHAPQFFHQPDYQTHANSAATLVEAILVADRPDRLKTFLEGFCGSEAQACGEGLRLSLGRQTLAVMTPGEFAAQFTITAPDLSRGPRFGGFTIGVRDMDGFRRHLDPSEQAQAKPAIRRFGTVIAAVADHPNDR